MTPTRILICCSGSVAALKVPEIAVELLKDPTIDLRIVCSEASLHFFNKAEHYNQTAWEIFEKYGGMNLVFTDEEEWNLWGKLGDPVLHIELSQWADIVLVSPASADLIAKIDIGISDTLLLSVLRAHDFKKPCIMCPAMNTMMWEHPVTEKSLNNLKILGWQIVDPVSKTLACNVVGVGAMAHIETIIETVNSAITSITSKNINEKNILLEYNTNLLKLKDRLKYSIVKRKEKYRTFLIFFFECVLLFLICCCLLFWKRLGEFLEFNFPVGLDI